MELLDGSYSNILIEFHEDNLKESPEAEAHLVVKTPDDESACSRTAGCSQR